MVDLTMSQFFIGLNKLYKEHNIPNNSCLNVTDLIAMLIGYKYKWRVLEKAELQIDCIRDVAPVYIKYMRNPDRKSIIDKHNSLLQKTYNDLRRVIILRRLYKEPAKATSGMRKAKPSGRKPIPDRVEFIDADSKKRMDRKTNLTPKIYTINGNVVSSGKSRYSKYLEEWG